jgi:hypothetical protein
MNAGPHTKVTVTISVIGSLILFGWWAGVALGDKADKREMDRELNGLRGEINELSAKRREDFVIQRNILSLLEKMDSRMGKIEDNQSWQIQQEVKRLQWQTFKQEPPSNPSPNVNR